MWIGSSYGYPEGLAVSQMNLGVREDWVWVVHVGNTCVFVRMSG
jgi:hypothetical protein